MKGNMRTTIHLRNVFGCPTHTKNKLAVNYWYVEGKEDGPDGDMYNYSPRQ